MEAIDMGQDFLAYVDFAHTPNALQRTLETARQMTRGQGDCCLWRSRITGPREKADDG